MSGNGFQGIAWDDAGTFVVVGEDGTLLRSSDDGATWQPIESGTAEALFTVATDRRGGWVAGGSRGNNARTARVGCSR